MPKLHELLAVEPDLKADAQRAQKNTNLLFTQATSQFEGQNKSYTVTKEGEDQLPSEIRKVATTVSEELENFQEIFSNWMDVVIQKEVTNQSATADVVVEGELLLKGVPATALLNLEGKLTEVLQIYKNIPTYDPTIKWTFNDDLNVFVSDPVTTYRTKKMPKVLEKSPATDKHPAQVDVFNEDVRVGEYITVNYSGMISVKDKRELLKRVNTLLRAVKEARQRANDTEAIIDSYADKIFGYINKGK